MKVEAICTNDGCPTVRENGIRTVQLLSAARLSAMRIPMDEDGNVVECPFCSSPVLIDRMAREEAQFPLGEIVVSGGARFTLAFGELEQTALSWAAPAAKLVMRHARGDFGSVTLEIVEANLKTIEEGPLDPYGTITSQYEFNNELLWVRTSRMPTQTTVIMLPSEYKG